MAVHAITSRLRSALLQSGVLRSVSVSWASGARRRAHQSTFTYRTHTCGELREEHVGRSVSLCGWIRRPRILGPLGVAFIPLTDVTGVIQLVCDTQKWQTELDSLGAESVVRAEGVIKPRPPNDINKTLPTGAVEVHIETLEILNKAENLPFDMNEKGVQVSSSDLLLKERPLDLRRPTLQKNLRLRSQVAMAMREFLINNHGFVEIETPTLHRRTPEGAREFIVPTREPGKFYSLTQSPQQFKQLLMVGGFERYFQFARCYRDEDLSFNRQPEFTQVDLELSFITEEEILGLMEELLTDTLSKTTSHLKIASAPFPRIPYKEAMEKYGSDKPDTRYGMELQSLDHIWEQCRGSEDVHLHLQGFKVQQWEAVHKSLTRKQRAALQEELSRSCSQNTSVALISHKQVDIVKPSHNKQQPNHTDQQLLHGSSSELYKLCLEVLNAEDGDLCVIGASKDASTREAMLNVLGTVRTQLAAQMSKTGHLELDPEQLNFLWVTDFPLFEFDEEGTVGSTHHPFTAPIPEHEHSLSQSWQDISQLTKIQGQHYDLVVNGVELGGGSIRIHRADTQEHVLKNILKIPLEQFSHLLRGLRSGCPPHGGIALGFDRLMAVLCGASSLKEVIAFPKSINGRDVMTGAPSRVDDEDLETYHISLRTASK